MPPQNEGEVDAGDPTLSFPDGFPGSVLVEGSFQVPYVAISSGELLKDLGREITLINAERHQVARYREVQRVNGAATEGVGGLGDPSDSAYGCFFVKVWSADGQGVYVVRTG